MKISMNQKIFYINLNFYKFTMNKFIKKKKNIVKLFAKKKSWRKDIISNNNRIINFK